MKIRRWVCAMILAGIICAWPGLPAIASPVLFCPAQDTMIDGYECRAFIWSANWGTGPQCNWCVCDVDYFGDFPHPGPIETADCFIALPNGLHAPGALDLPDPPLGSILSFRVQPHWLPNTTICATCGCLDVWWVPSLDLNAACVCPNGEC